MASLKELKNRISSVKNTQKITKAMQMVAAAKLRKAQEAAEASRPYSERMAAVIANLAASMGEGGDAPELLVGNGSDDIVLLVVMAADRGLAGGFNSNIVRRAREEIVSLERAGKDVKLYIIGKKARDGLQRLYGDKIVHYISLKEERTLHAGIAQGIGEDIVSRFREGEFDRAVLVYSQFKNVMTQEPVAQQLIPAGQHVVDSDEALIAEEVTNDLDGAIYTYEPSEAGILEILLPRNINTQIFSALLENHAGEMGSKMTAMDNATRNAGEMIDKLTLTFNRTRQAKITSELIEIISGAEAL